MRPRETLFTKLYAQLTGRKARARQAAPLLELVTFWNHHNARFGDLET